MAKLNELYRRLIEVADSTQPVFLLAVRLFWGWHFFQAGKGKLLNLERTTKFFESLGVPFPELSTLLAASTECFGGLLLLVGLCSRLAAIPLIFTMVVAFMTAHYEALSNVVADTATFLKQAPFTYLFASLLILVFGPGKYSIDGLIAARRKRQS